MIKTIFYESHIQLRSVDLAGFLLHFDIEGIFDLFLDFYTLNVKQQLENHYNFGVQ